MEGRPYAYALLAFPGDVETSSEREPIGLAVYYFTFESWAGRPGLYVSAESPELVSPYIALIMAECRSPTAP